ncbi:hypothetical protein RY831_00405 [Noviherbaspirillum sp. CPCC 100848]|uniref:Protein kinase domain-containing protein n=1 Tax=Noviherbaspirillum album TaxID=3080276 RepID=A0ABU6J1V6_9BURK|nr:hypothetical protein [Noviherbaspirillum sp. CPCC 100848]MEC4717602.1 hypothetical protein [Noviherbaspirillum sp. CPCC 100848]
MAQIERLLAQEGAVPMQWETDCGPLPGMPDIDWNTIKPTRELPGESSFGCIVRLQARRIGPRAKEQGGVDQNEQVQLAAKFMLDEHGSPGQAAGQTKSGDKLREELAIYRNIIEARPGSNALSRHPNLCEFYGIVTMNVDGVQMRALLMEAVPGHDAQKTADILGRCLDANYLAAREYWGAIQYLCDCTLDATEHLRKAGIVDRDIRQDGIMVREDGAVKIVDYGPTKRPGDTRRRSPLETISEDYRGKTGAGKANDVYALGATAAELAEGYRRKLRIQPGGGSVGLPPKNGTATGFIQRSNMHAKAVETPANHVDSAYLKFVNSVLRMNGATRPVMPNAARQTDFIQDPMMSHEEAQAVIQAAFQLAAIEEKKNAGASWKPGQDARQTALHLIRNKQSPMPGAGGPTIGRNQGTLAPPQVSRFHENPNLENYLNLKHHYSNRQDKDEVITKILKSIPDTELKTLKDEISSVFKNEGDRLLKSGMWIDTVKGTYMRGRGAGIPGGPAASAVKDALRKEGKSIQDLRSHIDAASRFFKDLKAISHPLTPVDWTSFNQVGALTKTALMLMSDYKGIQRTDPRQGYRDNSHLS